MNNTVCFTGHRPNLLPFKLDEEDKNFLQFKSKLTNIVINLINNGYTNFISGMALGIDTLCAEIILELKQKFNDLKLICCLPCKNQDRFWTNLDKLKYQNILKSADKIIYAVNKNYCTGCLQLRNKIMVDNSEIVVAVYYGINGGTKQTIEYAKTQDKKIIFIQ